MAVSKNSLDTFKQRGSGHHTPLRSWGGQSEIQQDELADDAPPSVSSLCCESVDVAECVVPFFQCFNGPSLPLDEKINSPFKCIRKFRMNCTFSACDLVQTAVKLVGKLSFWGV